MKKGISLIVLVITIIVIIILAGSVILSLSSNNPILQAIEAKSKASVEAYNSELNMVMSSQYLLNYSFSPSDFNAPTWDGIDANKAGTIKQYITTITPADALKYEIQGGKLTYIGTVQTEKDLNTSMSITNATALYTMTKPLVSDVNKYKTPYVPTGFTYKEGKWDTGLVIKDSVGNEFVWIPVDGTAVKYEEWGTTGVSYTLTTEDTLPTGVAAEATQITNYGGFYIARYEAGNASNVLVSKKAVSPWTNILYSDSKIKAESMYTTATVKSGLLTGTQWDTTMKWLENSGKNVTNGTSWGNNLNSTSPANVPGWGMLQPTGYSEFWKANNIYDMSGNAWEWSNEIYTTNRIIRSSDYHNGASPIGRNAELVTTAISCVSFRVVLYIL
jgi:hypothetical protein